MGAATLMKGSDSTKLLRGTLEGARRRIMVGVVKATGLAGGNTLGELQCYGLLRLTDPVCDTVTETITQTCCCKLSCGCEPVWHSQLSLAHHSLHNEILL